MRYKLFCLIILAALVFAASSTNAQTTAAGPYYATPSWDQKLQCETQATCPRFIVLSNWNNEAVLDRETGLVWERSPLPGFGPGGNDVLTWSLARVICSNRNVGGRSGWRLPSFQELASLVDPSEPPPGPTLPAGHPFTNLQPVNYWTATTSADFPAEAWTVNFTGAFVGGAAKTAGGLVWCVRGGGVLDNY